VKTANSRQDQDVITRSLGWEVAQLKDLCERITKGSTPTSYGYSYKTEGIRFVKAENIDINGIASTTTNYIDKETNNFLKRSILKENDLLFSIAGTIGRVGRIRATDLPANTNQALAITRLRPGYRLKISLYFLKSDTIQRKPNKNCWC
jgi:type I restriction enzyme S subunit